MLRMRGNLGKLQVGYQVAVQFRSWSLTCNQEVVGNTDWQLTAVVDAADSYWSTQRLDGIRLELDDRVWWRWSEVAIISGTVAKGNRITVVFRGDPDIRES